MRNLIFTAAILGLAIPAYAYETDQLTARQLTPPDASVKIDDYINTALERARARAETKLRKGTPAEKMSTVLRKEIIKEFPFNYLYFGAPIEKWMTETLAPQGFAVEPDGKGTGWKTNIYDQYKSMYSMNPLKDLPTPAMVFGIAKDVAGTYIAPTFVTTDGIRYGADKWSHFFRLGYRYWLRSHDGKDETPAIHYGTQTEMGGVGYLTSGALSYADLAANYDGFRFFRAVLGGDHPYFTVTDGHVVQVRVFHSSDYVSEDWDEYLNPCIYRPHMKVAIQKHLHKNRARVCAEYAEWRDVNGTPRVPLRPKHEYADLSVAPPQDDPFRLEELCRP